MYALTKRADVAQQIIVGKAGFLAGDGLEVERQPESAFYTVGIASYPCLHILFTVEYVEVA